MLDDRFESARFFKQVRSRLAYPPITQFSTRDKMARVLMPRSSSPCCCAIAFSILQ